MSSPSVPLATWLLAAFDPALIAVAATLGWKADQLGKVFLAAIAAVGVSLLFAWTVTRIGVPWVAPVGHESPTLVPVRAIAALLWAAAGYAMRRLVRRRLRKG